MADIPEEARQSAFETPFEGADTVSADSKATISEDAVQAAVRAHECAWVAGAGREDLVRATLEAALSGIASQVRRETAEQIAAAILAVDPVEWALAGQHAGQDAARIARQIGEGRVEEA
ncbi:hypothetical protein ACIBHX_01810 [Nonomuraea sp. NPDC050536]|uniref:hypothetical protein n=1 Tax=Nonomuraea sp. NPDC050536 TaxID=3364366 RepID=UPI0037C69223